MTLNDVKINQACCVKEITAQGRIKRRLLDMRITKDTNITVDKLAPLGDPIEIRIRNYKLSLRKEEASYILVELLGE